MCVGPAAVGPAGSPFKAARVAGRRRAGARERAAKGLDGRGAGSGMGGRNTRVMWVILLFLQHIQKIVQAMSTKGDEVWRRFASASQRRSPGGSLGAPALGATGPVGLPRRKPPAPGAIRGPGRDVSALASARIFPGAAPEACEGGLPGGGPGPGDLREADPKVRGPARCRTSLRAVTGIAPETRRFEGI